MTEHPKTPAHAKFWTHGRVFALGATFIVLAVFIAANIHLVFVAFTSQPDCVPHLKSAMEGTGDHIAANSSC